jgi:hypothetical protein
MYNVKNHTILPKLETDNFYVNEVGISFAMKTSIFASGLRFTPSPIEDYEYLNKMREENYIIMISPHIKYFVNGPEIPEMRSTLGNRAIASSIAPIHSEGFSNMIPVCNSWWYVFIFVFIFSILYLLQRAYTVFVSKKTGRNPISKIMQRLSYRK